MSTLTVIEFWAGLFAESAGFSTMAVHPVTVEGEHPE
jgi:hypothetical protein